jgi:hypothetical protein
LSDQIKYLESLGAPKGLTEIENINISFKDKGIVIRLQGPTLQV